MSPALPTVQVDRNRAADKAEAMDRAPLPDCVMLWIGERLSAVERACMRSVLAQGHRLTLYTYGEMAGVPEGVERADAAAILPQSAIVAHHSGSVALFSDWFRIELQRHGKGIWLDADVYLLRPLTLAPGAHLFGWIEPDMLGAGVLALPPDSPLIAPVLKIFEHPHVPDWLRPPDRIRAYWRQWRTGAVDVSRLPWGVAGPLALTALARRHGLLQHALRADAFYPYGWAEAAWIFDPARTVEEFIGPGTTALHLYNYIIADRKLAVAAPGSFMARLQQEGA